MYAVDGVFEIKLWVMSPILLHETNLKGYIIGVMPQAYRTNSVTCVNKD